MGLLVLVFQLIAATPPCNVADSTAFSFSSPSATDRLVVSVSGPSCFSASVVIAIRSASGTELYRYDTPLAILLPRPEIADLKQTRLQIAEWLEVWKRPRFRAGDWPARERQDR